jgi:death-on-curing protein
MIKYLTLEQVLKLHDAVVERFGGLTGIRDPNLLLSCIESPKMVIFGEDLYPSVYDKAAVYLFNIVCNHPFNDGNKRTGAGAAYLFLKINKIRIPFDASPEDMTYENFVVKVARDKTAKEEIAYFLEHGEERDSSI